MSRRGLSAPIDGLPADAFALVPGWAGASLDDLGELAWASTTVRVFGRTMPAPRLTCWYGDAGATYGYSGHAHNPAPMPPLLAVLRDALEHATGARFNSCLGNLYRTGWDSVGWHADDEPELGPEPVIASLSFGAERTFRVRAGTSGPSTAVVLRHGDLLVMRGRAQTDYQHSIPKTERPVGPRVNLTFRLIK